MNYFELHIGDYQRKTAHLTLAEHGAYSLMLQAFYATERPLPADRKVLHRLLRADSLAERKAVDAVVSQFWHNDGEGLTNRRAQEVLDLYHQWVEKQRTNGGKGGRPPKTNGLSEPKPNGNPTVPQTETQTKANGGYHARVPLPTSHLDSPLPKEDPTPTPPKGGADRHRRISPERAEKDAALEVWHQLTASDGALPKRDSKLQAVIDAVGGWSRIAQREQGIDDSSVRKAFCEAYRRVS